MERWLNELRHDPIPVLRASTCPAIRFRTELELMERENTDLSSLWDGPEVTRIISRQRPDGSWKYPGRRAGLFTNYEYLETFRNLGVMVEKYAMDQDHPAVANAADFLFSLQTEEGDFRGIYGNDYSPNYSASVMELLIKAGYSEDERITRGFRWLLSIRQKDGGWAIPMRTVGRTYHQVLTQEQGPTDPDRSRPFSHLVTGTVLRAFAVHPQHRHSEEARRAGELLASRFFLSDKYPDRKDPSYWTKFSFPFWFTDLLSSLDSLSRIGFSPQDPHIGAGIDWFVQRQREDGSWRLHYLRDGDKDVDLWVHFALCRAIKRFYP